MTEIHEKKDMGSTYNKIRFPRLRFICDLQMRTRRSPLRIRWSISVMYLEPLEQVMAMAFSVLQALPSQRRVALSVGRSLSKLKYTTIVRVNKSETLSKIFFVLRLLTANSRCYWFLCFLSFNFTPRTNRGEGRRSIQPPSFGFFCYFILSGRFYLAIVHFSNRLFISETYFL